MAVRLICLLSLSSCAALWCAVIIRREVDGVILDRVIFSPVLLGHMMAATGLHPGSTPRTGAAIEDPRVITYFDREDKASLPTIIGELAGEMATTGRSVMVHKDAKDGGGAIGNGYCGNAKETR